MQRDAAVLATLCAIAQEAGQAILRIYASAQPAVQRKPDDSPLTAADLAADECIARGLAREFGGIAVVSEETRGAGPPAGAFFLVDPLDGTREFLARNGEFTVNIAWVQGGVPRLGVVHAPVPGLTYAGAEDLGAWRHQAGDRQRVHVAPPPAPGQVLRVLASRSHGNAAQSRLLARLPQPHRTSSAGSSLKFCRLAEGAADLYPRLSPTMAWDTAAGQAVLQAAGGVVLCADGRPLAVPADPHSGPNAAFMAACAPALAMAAWQWAAAKGRAQGRAQG